nr:hypothetical protein [Tanacetum cinerariifolium]
PKIVLTEKKKIKQYISGLPSSIKGKAMSSKPANLNEAVRMAHALHEQRAQDWRKRQSS